MLRERENAPVLSWEANEKNKSQLSLLAENRAYNTDVPLYWKNRGGKHSSEQLKREGTQGQQHEEESENTAHRGKTTEHKLSLCTWQDSEGPGGSFLPFAWVETS